VPRWPPPRRGPRGPAPEGGGVPGRPGPHRVSQGLGRVGQAAEGPPRSGLQALPRPVWRRSPRPGGAGRALRGGPPRLLGLEGAPRPLEDPCSGERPDARHPHGALQGRQLVRAGGLGPVRDRLRGPPQPDAPADPRRLRGSPHAQGLPHGPAPRPEGVEEVPGEGPRGLGGDGRQLRPFPPRHARGLPRAGPDGWRDDRRRRGRAGLHAPELREDGGDPDLPAGDPVHGPAELLLLVHERPRRSA